MSDRLCTCGATIPPTAEPPVRCACGAVYSEGQLPKPNSRRRRALQCLATCERNDCGHWGKHQDRGRTVTGCGRLLDVPGFSPCKTFDWIHAGGGCLADDPLFPGLENQTTPVARCERKRGRYRVAMAMPRSPAWAGPARAGLFSAALERAGYEVTTLSMAPDDPVDLEGFDLVLNHAMQIPPDVVARCATRQPGTVFVTVNHSAIAHLERLGDRYVRLFDESLRIAATLPNCWYASQEPVAETIGRAAGISRCVWLPTPGHPIIARKYRAPGDPATVVLAGRTDSIKNNLVQLVACGLVMKIRLVLCMDPSHTIQQVVDRLGIECEWRGKLEHADWLSFLQHEPDVVLCCSLAESFGYVAAEAMASGVPVVGSDAIRFCDPALRAQTASPEDIAAKISRALSAHSLYAATAAKLGREVADRQTAGYLAKIEMLAKHATANR